MLQAKNVRLTLIKDNRLIINDFSFTAGPGEKAVIIGEEGNGKSTLLKYLYDEECVSNYVSADGTVIRKGKYGYLPQFMPEYELCMTVSEYFSDVDIYTNYEYISDLQLDYDMLSSDQIIRTLSGGEKIKIQLLKMLCDTPDLIFFDEPSNDLDIDTLTFLENFIKQSTIPIIFISHDETLIENTANTIIHIEQLIRKTQCKITISRQDYPTYLSSRNFQFDRQTQIAKKERSEYRKKRERLLQLYEKAKSNSGWKNPDGIAASDGRAKKSMQSLVSKGKRFERESENFTEIPDREEGIITRFDNSIIVPSHKKILDFSLKELVIDGKMLSKDIALSVVGREHICIIGKNGVGKSTLLKAIWNTLKDREDIQVGYMPQNYQDVLDFDKTPMEYLQSNYDKENQSRAMTFMGNMKFTADEMMHKIGDLSGGQKAKLIFLNMVLKKCNVLILDEPTRNFSPLSAPVVRQALIDFNGTIISISHDRKYLDEVADKIYILNENGLSQL